MSWNKLCNKQDLQLLSTLSGGQSFRWIYNEELKEWRGVFSKTAWKLRESEHTVEYNVIGSLLLDTGRKRNNKGDHTNDTFKKVLNDYFRLDCNLNEYYEDWSDKDNLFKSACKQFYGIRMLNQEPIENLFSFICSQNNHISRISSMVEKLCENYGEKICDYEDVTYYAFPDVEKLAPNEVDKSLRDLGFGYRAKFIQKSAAQILEWGGEKWFESLKEMKYKDAKQELIKLCGIGPKVADCICLMSLNHLDSVPVDTHVYQIAAQNYLPHLRGKKSVTDKMYTEIGDHFRRLFGDKAGWAHTILFCADLKKFQTDMDTEKPKRKRKK